jgi:signal transduction histidine kinase
MVVFISALLRSEQESRRRAEQLRLDMESISMTLERERIARDIHDSLGHALTGLNIQLQLAQKLQDTDQAKSREAIGLARGFAARAVADVRRALRAVRDSYFDFPAAVKELVEMIEASGTCKVTVAMDPVALPPQFSHNLFFLIQEGLTNIQRHAQASVVNVQLTCTDQIFLRVKDNGIGFSLAGTAQGFGIKGMEERVASLGGVITIATAAGEGTDISITVPMSATVAKDSADDQSAGS